jgi:RHS repeat-associated protein
MYSFVDANGHDNGNVSKIAHCLEMPPQGQWLGSTSGSRNQNFTYDSLNRISQAWTDGSNWGEQFTIDAWGNLTGIAPCTAGSCAGKAQSEGLSVSVGANNQLTGSGFGYDARGNQNVAVDAAGATHQYAYNAESQLVAVDGGVASYQYDGDGERAVKNLQSGGTLYWPGPDGALLAESDLTGNLTAEYVYFGGQRIARTDYSSGSATLKYYLTDRLGSTIGVVDATFANVLEDSDYYPYGREIPVVSSDSNHYKFGGKEQDTETGNDYFGARYYGSNTGRWMIPDWAAKATAVPYADFGDPQTLNLYAYVRNNPVAGVDADGHEEAASNGGLNPNGTTPNPEPGSQPVQSNVQNTAHLDSVQVAQNQQIVVVPDKKADFKYGSEAREQQVDYNLAQLDSKGNTLPVDYPTDHKVELKEKLLSGDPKKVTICTGQCVTQGTATDQMSVTAGKGHSVEKRFFVDGNTTKIYDPGTKKAYDFVRVDASVKKGFVFNYGNDPQ